MSENPLWVERYRPQTVSEAILPAALKKTFQQIVDDGVMPNMILSGGSGTGKTTVPKAICNELGFPMLFINGSMDRNIDTLRTDIQQFASAKGRGGKRKVVVIDEADYLNPTSTQPALRNFIEEHSKNCAFVLTCNYRNRILGALQSRCTVIDFVIPKEEKPQMMMELYERLVHILKTEGVGFEKPAVIELVKKFFPDMRRTIMEAQRLGSEGDINMDVVTNIGNVSIQELVKLMKDKDFTAVRRWVGENSDLETPAVLRSFYDEAAALFTPASIPQLVLFLADYQYKDGFVADHEINLAACMAEIMVHCQFK